MILFSCCHIEFTSCTGTVQQELQSLKQENESKTTQLNTAMEDLNATLVNITMIQVQVMSYVLSNSVTKNTCKMT